VTEGPYLYDDEPAPLHTGTPRQRNGWLIGGLLAVVLLAVVSAALLLLVKGSPEEQAREVVGVFLAALDDGDTETAHQLLCDEQQAQLDADDVAGEYLRSESGQVVGAAADQVDGEPVQRVQVRWADGATSELTVVPEEGAKVCGIR
jgi:hypothetical protein